MAQRVVVFANGVLQDPAAVRAMLRPEDRIVAADGGTHHALACGVTPQTIIGDLDSLDSNLQAQMRAQGVEFIDYPAAKDETDLELALLYVASLNVQTVLVVGGLGGRLDQMIANLQLLARPELAHLEMQLAGDDGDMVYLMRHALELHGAAGDRVSLLPWGGDAVGVTTQGLEWPLTDATLHFYQARGVSNVMLGASAQVRVEHGLLLCIHSPGPHKENES